jgi:hypothetical protein
VKQVIRCFVTVFGMASLCFADAGTLAPVSKSDVWMDETQTLIVTRTRMVAAVKEEDVRAQIAGVLDSMFHTGLLLRPDRMEFDSFDGLPEFTVEGLSYANFTSRRCKIAVVFSKSETFVIQSWAPAKASLPNAEKVVKVEGEKNEFTAAAFAFLKPRMAEALPTLQKTVETLIEQQTKANHSPDPTPASVTPAAAQPPRQP